MTTFGLDLGSNDLREPVTISALEFDVLWEHLRLETMPLVLKVPSPGKTHAERAELERRAWAELDRRGLGRPVSLDPMLEDLLHLLNRPQHEVDGRLWLGHSVRVLAAAKGQSAVLAVLAHDQLTLRPASAEGLPREALSVLPPLPAGPGHSVTLPSADLDAAAATAKTPDELHQALVSRGIRDEDARTLADMFRDADHRGQFGAASRDKWGKRVRQDRVVSFFDTPRGRYLQLRRATPGQQPWSTVSPVDARRLTQHLTDLTTPS
ncbi:ESAT-6 protein secretion system EspG family protein [Saccharothrix saharensis]|uniref:ESAT-6 protein secretion system EspG family protein n=1 Tax=Saccharothrix saharensis TaxID=571190 RepID=A0A543JIN3_9PSEU|nr:ESX secretion-associated protein EspG [Saccharothrix saharensis]TQM82732.1 ESAT-6 protein secretion system EspG family protein [Saccharothrix saharensis]